MDAVITYVDGLDPLWQADYAAWHDGKAPLAKRFRDWGTLPFLLRGIESNMPFIEKVHLVVARESQVPSWVNRETVHVVLHEEIMPEGCLPCFNSCSIEMFLHRIPGLSEEYLYFNDDMFPVAPCSAGDFFVDGRCATGFARCFGANTLYRKQTRSSDRLARKALGLRPGLSFRRPQHCPSPMLKSACEKACEAVETEILSRLSRLRTPSNTNQYFFMDYCFYSGRALNRRLSNKHLSLAVNSAGKIEAFLSAPTRKLCCINDVEMPDEQYRHLRERMLKAFGRLLPAPSRFEKTCL